MMHKWGLGTFSAALMVPSLALADDAGAVRVRFSTASPNDEIEHAACALATAFESGDHAAAAFDVRVNDHRCSSEPLAPDAVALRVRIDGRAVTLESESDVIPRADLERAVTQLARSLRQKLIISIDEAPPVRIKAPPSQQSEGESTADERRKWKEGDSIPLGYHTESQPRWGAVGAGAATFTLAYVLSAIGAALDGSGVFGWLYVPIVGPYVLTVESFALAPLTLGLSAITGVSFLFDAFAQTAGVAILIYGAVSKKTVLVRNEFGIRDLVPVPFATRDAAGLSVIGRF
jgi:hypothetical protein